MIPWYSWSVPGRNPGTSTNVTSGMLNASHVRTNRAAFSDASMSSVPASTLGWLATIPTARPSSRANPITTFIAQNGKTSKKSPSSTMRRITSCMSYGSRAESGITCVSPSSWRSGSSTGANDGASSRLFDGRYDSRWRTIARHSSSSWLTNDATPERLACVIAPPSSSNVTSSPVTALITSGPVMNMCEVSRTMKVKSVIAGE